MTDNPSPQRMGRTDDDGVYHPSHYDMPTPPGGPKHWVAVRGHHPDCPACAREQEIAERKQ